MASQFEKIYLNDYRLDNWQMSESEKIILFGLLQLLKPQLSIEVGTFCGGSLSMISKFSEKVYSLDIDQTASDFIDSKNVTFILGDSEQTLPQILKQSVLDSETPNFILIDGNHSENGIKYDISSLLNFRGWLARCTVLFHDFGNPICKAAAASANHRSVSDIIDPECDATIQQPSSKRTRQATAALG